MLTLRPYQAEAIDAIFKAELRGFRRLLIALPTGTGKTVIFAHLKGIAIHAYHASVGLACLLTLRHALVMHARAIARQPFRAAMRPQPFRCHHSQLIEGMPHCFGRTYHAIEGPNRPQHMRGICPLPTTGSQPLALPAPFQEGIEELGFGLTGDHACAELAEHGAVKTGVRSL
jgi:energy-coupling factor transporter ATP-binding protein EcfA2